MTAPMIMVPLDGSKFAECALPIAVDVACKLKYQIGLVSVSPEGSKRRHRHGESKLVHPASGDNSKRSKYLEITATRLEAASSIPVECTVLVGSAARELVEYSTAQRPRLIVMSTHGRGPLSRAWLGSVADWVVRHASMPVLLMRPEDDEVVDLAHRTSIDNLLIPLDGSRQSEASLEWANAIGSDHATYTLVRIARDSMPVWSVDRDNPSFDIRDYTKAGYVEATEYLRGVERLVQNGTRNTKTVVVEGVPPVFGILNTAKEEEADLIAITTHGRGGLPRLILGSVTDKVVRASHVPVLVVRPK